MKPELSKEEMANLTSQICKELETCPPMKITFDPHDAFVLATNLPLVFQHPCNQKEPAMQSMQELFWTLQKLFEERSPEVSRILKICGEQNPYLTESK
ncbi:MAG: hypothetical protein F6K35_26400 [Okeania sp. SIO2H7]|nr:hypothetical protein [Okeania sp. SIO2H7]